MDLIGEKKSGLRSSKTKSAPQFIYNKPEGDAAEPHPFAFSWGGNDVTMMPISRPRNVSEESTGSAQENIYKEDIWGDDGDADVDGEEGEFDGDTVEGQGSSASQVGIFPSLALYIHRH